MDAGRLPLGPSGAPSWAAAHAPAKRERRRRGHGSGPRCWAVRYAELGGARETGGGKGKTGHQQPKAERARRKRKTRTGWLWLLG